MARVLYFTIILFGSKRKNFEYGFNVFKNDFINFYKSLKIDSENKEFHLGFENLFPNPDGSNDSFMCDYEEISKIFNLAKTENINLKLLDAIVSSPIVKPVPENPP